MLAAFCMSKAIVRRTISSQIISEVAIGDRLVNLRKDRHLASVFLAGSGRKGRYERGRRAYVAAAEQRAGQTCRSGLLPICQGCLTIDALIETEAEASERARGYSKWVDSRSRAAEACPCIVRFE